METEALEQRDVYHGDTSVTSNTETQTAREIDDMLQHFDRHMRDRLMPSISKGPASDEVIRDAIWQCFEEQDYKEFQLDVLGVCGGGFGLSHNSRKHFILFQSNAIQPSDIKGTRLPYLSRKNEGGNEGIEGYQHLIDWLFLGRRRKQPLMGTAQTFSPEFYWQLAQVYYPKYRAFEPSPFTEYLQSKRSPYVYCPIGEVAFFLYAWRFLFRQLQKSGSLQSPIGRLSLNHEEPYECLDVWKTSCWADQTGLRPEWEWLTALDELEKLGQEEEARDELKEFKLKVRDQWERWHRELDTEPSQFFNQAQQHPWRSDWFNVGLLSRDEEGDSLNVKPTSTLLSVIRFARYVSKDRDRDLERFESIVIDNEQQGSGMEWSALEEFDLTLQKTVLRLLRQRNNGGASLASLFSELHSLARFPVLPFFYWTAVDGQPKEHFVFPVWESWRFPVEIKVPKMPSDRSTLVVPSVGIALIAIRPMREFGLRSFDDPHSDKEEIYLEAHRRLFRTERFFVRIVRPIIDAAFYGILVRDSAHSEGQAEQVESWAHSLQTKLALLQVLYDRLSAEASHDETITVRQETWINIGGSLRSVRRTINALSYYNRVREYLRQRKTDFIALRHSGEAKYLIFNRGIGHLFLDAFQLMAAKVRLGDQKYGDLATRLPAFKKACEIANLPPLMTQDNEEYPVSFEELKEFFPADRSVEFRLQIPQGATLDNFEVWEEIELRGPEKVVFGYDAIVGVVIDEILSNACKHVNRVRQDASITIDLAIEMDNNAQTNLGWATVKVSNTAAFEGSRSEIPESRSLLDWKRDKGLGLFFNRELCETLTGDGANFEVSVDADCRHVVSTFRFPVSYSPTLT